MKLKFVLILSLAIGLLAAFLSRAWIDSKNAETEKIRAQVYAGAVKIQIVAAARPLPSGTTIQYSDLGTLSVFATSVTDDNTRFADISQIVGRKLIHSLDTKNPILWTYIEGGKQGEKTISAEAQLKQKDL